MKIHQNFFGMILLTFLLLTGCTSQPQPDTVVILPAKPTRPAETESVPIPTQLPAPTATPTEVPPEPTAGAQQKPHRPKPAQPKVTEPPAVSPTVPVTVPVTVAVTEPPADPTPQDKDVYDISDYVPGNLEASIVEAINALRAENGLPALSKSSRLCAICSVRAYEASVSWSHTRPDGRPSRSVLSDYGYGCGSAKELLLATTTGISGEGAVRQWSRSEKHLALLLSPDFTTAGFGIYKKGGKLYIAGFLTA